MDHGHFRRRRYGRQHWAVRLVRDTLAVNRTGVAAAVAANNTARKIGERQVRAYVHITKVEFEHVDDKFKPAVNVHYKNFGQSPAKGVVNKANVHFVMGGEPGRPRLSEKPIHVDERGMDLGPGQDTTTTALFSWIPGLREALEGGFTTMYVAGRIEYVDVFRKRHQTRYRLQLHVNPEGLTDTDSFVICKEGNEST